MAQIGAVYGGAGQNGLSSEGAQERALIGQMGVGLPDQATKELSEWIEAHIEATLRRGPPRRWRWDWAAWGWML